MIKIEQLLNPSRIACQQELVSKKLVLEKLSELLTGDLPDIETQDVLLAFINRERLGSTDLGHGVALPHVRHHTVSEPRAAFIQLATAIEFDPIKHTEVDLVFALVVPDDAQELHLQILGSLARLLSQAECRHQLRQATSPSEIQAIMDKHHESSN